MTRKRSKIISEKNFQFDALLCRDLPTRPICDIGKILVTGGSGYIGGRLIPELIARGYKVRVLVRKVDAGYLRRWPHAEVIEADAIDPKGLVKALRGIHTAYYLIHSLLLGPKSFSERDREAAENFKNVAEKEGVKRIIYLGGLGEKSRSLSEHLRSRLEIAEILRRGKVPVTELRAAVVLGSGSASYEIMQYLVKRLPVIGTPRWAKNKCQPIGIRDVIRYLVGSLESKETIGNSYDIGGEDILSYREMLEILAGVEGKKRVFYRSPISNLRVYSYLVSLITPVPAPIVHCLVEGLRSEVVCRDHSIKDIIPIQTRSFEEALLAAKIREEMGGILSRWSDAYPPGHELEVRLDQLPVTPEYRAAFTIESSKTPMELFQSFCRIGGKIGWFQNNWMWRLRGLVDRMLLGVGSTRGRKDQTRLEVHDVIDFWRVEDLIENKRLLLRAEMKLPGKAWLEFECLRKNGKSYLTVRAYFKVFSLLGRIYWKSFLPFHRIIFQDLIQQIERRA